MTDTVDDLAPGNRWLNDELDGASNVLIRSSCFGGGKTRACADLLANHGTVDTNALVLTCAYPANRWLELYRANADVEPRTLVIIGVGGNSNDVETTWSDPNGVHSLTPGEPVIDGIGDPADFTGIGIKITQYLHAFEETRFDDGPSTITCCVDSVTALLQYADQERVYRFLKALTTWIRDTNATAHYHLDPEAHDPQEIAVLEPIFDATVDATQGSDPSDWTIQRL